MIRRSLFGLAASFLLPVGLVAQQPSSYTDRLEASPQAVIRAQVGLKQLGYKPGSVDGEWGPSSRAAARKFQSDFGLEVDGRLGAVTFLLLRRPSITGLCRTAEMNMDACLRAVIATAGGRSASSASREACGEAYEECADECDSAYDVYDYDSGDYIELYDTDFPEGCRDACEEGLDACEDADPDDCCEEFEEECSDECPSDIYDYSSGRYLLLTDAEDLCEEACEEGQDECEYAQ